MQSVPFLGVSSTTPVDWMESNSTITCKLCSSSEQIMLASTIDILYYGNRLKHHLLKNYVNSIPSSCYVSLGRCACYQEGNSSVLMLLINRDQAGNSKCSVKMIVFALDNSFRWPRDRLIRVYEKATRHERNGF